MQDVGRYTVDTPVPYRLSDLISLIDDRMGKLENKRDLAPYRNLKTRIETLSVDPRYTFMFGSLTVNDDMAQVLGRLFRVPVNGKPITILELTGLPTEIVNVVVAVLCRMTFDFALWSEGRIPVTLVCEEAHRYVPANPSLGFEPCKRAIARIAKEGRKYGASLCIVTQRPAEIDPTILSQCNTVFALRMSNDRDQAIVSSAISDSGSGLLEFLSALGPARGDSLRGRRDVAGSHSLRRAAATRHAAELDGTVLGNVAEVGGRRVLLGADRREMAPVRQRRRRPRQSLFAEALEAAGPAVGSRTFGRRLLAAIDCRRRRHHVQDPLLAVADAGASKSHAAPRGIPPRRDVPASPAASTPSQPQPEEPCDPCANGCRPASAFTLNGCRRPEPDAYAVAACDLSNGRATIADAVQM